MKGVELYRWMLLSRRLEAALCRENPRWFPAEGEEAAIVGSFAALCADDVAAPHYRGPFVVYLMRGAELRRLFCQALGRVGGYNKARSVPFTGPMDVNCIPWVAGDLGTSLGTATGAALALKQRKAGGVCVCSFGDGTVNRGDFHENVNLAALWKLPIVYVCQNNGWAISQSVDSYLPAPIVDRAAGYAIPGRAVDGNDVEAVRAVVASAVEHAGAGSGPTLIEARTWRVGGHWAGDKALYRGPDTVQNRPADPLTVQAARLLERGECTDDHLRSIEREVENEVTTALAYAKEQPRGGVEQLGLDEVYA